MLPGHSQNLIPFPFELRYGSTSELLSSVKDWCAIFGALIGMVVSAVPLLWLMTG